MTIEDSNNNHWWWYSSPYTSGSISFSLGNENNNRMQSLTSTRVEDVRLCVLPIIPGILPCFRKD